MNLLSDFFAHNTMMNQRLVAACRQLAPDQLDTTAVGTYGSIGATLVHIANAQVSYAARLLDVERSELLTEHPFPGFDALGELFAVGDAQLEAAVMRDDGEREAVVTGDDPVGSWRMPVALFLLQAINHGTEHRSQIATILTQLGVEPPEMDGWAYLLDSGRMIPIEPGTPEPGQ